MQLNYSRAFGGKDLKMYGLSCVPSVTQLVMHPKGLDPVSEDEKKSKSDQAEEVEVKVKGQTQTTPLGDRILPGALSGCHHDDAGPISGAYLGQVSCIILGSDGSHLSLFLSISLSLSLCPPMCSSLICVVGC